MTICKEMLEQTSELSQWPVTWEEIHRHVSSVRAELAVQKADNAFVLPEKVNSKVSKRQTNEELVLRNKELVSKLLSALRQTP